MSDKGHKVVCTVDADRTIPHQSSEDNGFPCRPLNYDSHTYDYKKIDESDTSENSTKILYQLKTQPKVAKRSPYQIHFKLYQPQKMSRKRNRSKSKTANKKTASDSYKETSSVQNSNSNSFLVRLKKSLSKMSQVSFSQKSKTINDEYLERIDIYYFDHGCSSYFQTTDCPPQILSEILANQTNHYATRFWAEIFGTLHVGMSFVIAFFIQAYRFFLYSFVRPIIVGFLQMTSDYFLKPFLITVFNGILQPFLILGYNVCASAKDMLEPVADIIDNFFRPICNLFSSIRLINISNKKEIKKHSENI